MPDGMAKKPASKSHESGRRNDGDVLNVLRLGKTYKHDVATSPETTASPLRWRRVR
jgi:hypothetical protein